MCCACALKARDSTAQAIHVALHTAGECVLHVLVYDAWRHIIFLSAGEVDEQWIAGIIGVCGDDLRGSKLDNRLRNELRIIELLDVRLLMERAAPAKKRKYSTADKKRAERAKKSARENRNMASVAISYCVVWSGCGCMCNAPLRVRN